MVWCVHHFSDWLFATLLKQSDMNVAWTHKCGLLWANIIAIFMIEWSFEMHQNKKTAEKKLIIFRLFALFLYRQILCWKARSWNYLKQVLLIYPLFSMILYVPFHSVFVSEFLPFYCFFFFFFISLKHTCNHFMNG